MRVLLTGAAGFIGTHAAAALLARGDEVQGLDSLAGYDPALKRARLRVLERHPRFRFMEADLVQAAADAATGQAEACDAVLHLAASLGTAASPAMPPGHVRRLDLQLAVLELCRRLPHPQHLVLASTSPGTAPSRDGEALLSRAHARLHGLPQTRLLFGTVYGPWDRPDSACSIYADAIAAGRPITLAGSGSTPRHLTYVDDLVGALLTALDHPPAQDGTLPVRALDLGPGEEVEEEPLVRMLADAMGRQALVRHAGGPSGEVVAVPSAPSAMTGFGWRRATSLAKGLSRFAAWHRTWPPPA